MTGGGGRGGTEPLHVGGGRRAAALLVLAALLLLVAVSFALRVDRSEGARSISGAVASVGDGRITIEPRRGAPVTLRLVEGIPITVRGRVSAATEIREGDPVEATYTSERGEWRAVRITVGPTP